MPSQVNFVGIFPPFEKFGLEIANVWGVLLVGDQPARQRCADRGQRLGAQHAENRHNRQCHASIHRKEACQNQALIEIVQVRQVELSANQI